ncbi:zinc-dependent metalloprotease [Kineosporia succinea]|uniref:EcxA zinc-binding domain-containing protein n=1 Tax=Kineosporia succinea TaxID=84632 RepID=A0ABT9PBG7_9ACTN|nr:zinc-dependent metalloprotease [Kineosporia succinea]MDP9829530.1 hypothetical protein [Kineosporia succinea]
MISLETTGTQALLTLPRAGIDVLALTMLTSGVGSSRINLDRGQPGQVRHWRFEPVGTRITLTELNTHFGSGTGRRDGAGSFARSMLAVLDPVASTDGTVTVDITALACRDLVEVRRWASFSSAGEPTVDPSRSLVDPGPSHTHEHGVEIESLLTFTGFSGDAISEVAPDPGAVTVRQRLSLTPLTDDPFPVLPFHPAAGGYGKMRTDTDTDPRRPPFAGVHPRFATREPIVFSVDPDIPQPYRDAVLEGGRWWATGFEAAGLPDTYRVEVRPRESDPAAVGTNAVWWVHRTGRGWSMGAALCDPRTGRIVKGNVRLGSQRVQQLTALGEALLCPYGHADEAARRQQIEQMTLARIRQLAAHEIGHALGLMHNYASHQHEHPSVMDYPFPALRVTPDGRVDLSSTYAQGLGPWDVFTVRYAYGDDTPEAKAAALQAERDAGRRYLTDHDGHSPDSCSPDAAPWIHGADPFEALERLLTVRAAALQTFGPGCLPPGRPTGEREDRFALLHLLHRHQCAALGHLIGGLHHEYALAGEDVPDPVPVPEEVQERAVQTLTGLLRPQIVRPHPGATACLTPTPIRYPRPAGAFGSAVGPGFDPDAATAAAATVVTDVLFQPQRLNRQAPAIGRVFRQAWEAAGGDPVTVDVVTRAALRAVHGGELHPSPRAELVQALESAPDAPAWLSAAVPDAARIPKGPDVVLPPGIPL